jgi:hypothetical protein
MGLICGKKNLILLKGMLLIYLGLVQSICVGVKITMEITNCHLNLPRNM